MITLAGHGKDLRLVQIELPIVPNVGDRIREDANSPNWAHKLPHLIREGEFIESGEYFGATFWKVKLDNGKFAKFNPQDSEIIERAIAPVLVEKEISQSLPEQFRIGDHVDTESCGKNLEIIEINGDWLRCKNKQGQKFFINRKDCSLTSIISEALEPLALQPKTLEKSTQSNTSTSAKTRKKSIKPTSLKSKSIATSKTITHPETSTCLQEDFPVQEPVLQEVKQGLTTQNLQCGLSTCDASEKDSPDSLSSKIPQDYSIAEWEQSYKGYPKAGTMRNGKLSPLPSLEVPKRGKEFLSLPTLTSNTATGSSRASGQSKLEKWLKDKGFLQDTQVLSAEMMATLFGFPKDWTLCLSDATGERLGELDLDIFSEGRSISTVQPLSLNESCISIAVLVGTIVKPKFNGGKGKVISSTKKKISVSWFGANNVVTYTIAEFHNQIDILSVPSPSIDEANLGDSDHAIAPKPSEPVTNSHIDDVLVESNVRALDERLAYLQSERDRLINSGASPKSVWLCHGKVPHRDFIQVVWKSNKPHEWLGGAKSRYIGKFDSDEHKSAIAQHRAGQELRKIEREIKKLQVKNND